MQNIISSHTVKPSSPTPVGFRIHKLSSLDQIATPVYIPLIFFYERDESKRQTEISRRLKQSLSETLTIFYPLAGTIKQNSFVDCDDSGAEFVEARVHSRLAPLIQNPKIETLKELVPIDSSSHDDNTILSVKTSFFDCGGIAIGVCLSHKIGDTASFAAFMNAWAATCRGESSRIIHPSFDLALHFPPADPTASALEVGFSKEKIVTRRLVFESKKIDKLRQEASATVKNPTRVESVSAFMWGSFIEAQKAKSATEEHHSSVASHVVNLRPRTVPEIPEQTFGNCITYAPATAGEDDVEYVSKLRAAIRAMDDDYINKVVKDDGFFKTLEIKVGDLFNYRSWVFSSWWRFPVYDVDFGWRRPVWVATTPMPYMNAVIMMSNPSGDAIEAWINISDDHFFQTLQANYNNLPI